VRSISAAARRIGSAAAMSSRSRTVESSRTCPMNWRMIPSPPERVTTARREPGRSPAMIRISVVLPVPFGPMSAVRAALADPQVHLAQQRPPVRQAIST
jgi:hypothetical protein